MKQNDNFFFDAFQHYAEQWQGVQKSIQKDWSKPIEDYWKFDTEKSIFDDFVEPEWVQQTQAGWHECQRQYSDWLKASKQWFPNGFDFNEQGFDFANADSASKMAFYSDSLKKMLDPSAFMQSGANDLNNFFERLVNVPEFADIGIYERQFLTMSSDWMALRKASANYQSVLANAWSKAFEVYEDKFQNLSMAQWERSKGKESKSEQSEQDQISSIREAIDEWLKIANQQLLDTQRSEEFLQAQKELVKAATSFKVKTREMVEAWSETFDVPTRSEINDLHKTVYALRSELRKVNNELAELKSTATSVAKAKPSKKPVAKAKPAKRVQK